ncbi:MAG: IPT/TIG domain-containing protein [Sandaracinaceae bacterium]
MQSTKLVHDLDGVARGAAPGASWGTAGLIAALLSMALVGCNNSNVVDRDFGVLVLPDAGVAPDLGPGFDDMSGIANRDFILQRLEPNVGPFTGGNVVSLRGNGFEEGARVTFGGIFVELPDQVVVDARRIDVVVPAGMPGPVDVEVTVGDETATLEDGYTYQQIVVEPDSGSIAGGTFVTLTGMGTAFEEGDEVFFGPLRCRDVEVVSTTAITCFTPAAFAGTVPVSIARGGVTTLTAEDAFTYFDSTDPDGGLGGGPIDGSINITVLEAGSGAPVPDAFVLVGNDLGTELQGFTDELGQITISSQDIAPPVTVHIAKFCYEATTFSVFDARDVSSILVRWQTLECADPGPPPPPGPGRNPSVISGELIWPTDVGTGPEEWFNLPEPRTGWRRVAKVFRARTVLRDPDPPALPPEPAIVLEEIVAGAENGYPYSLPTFPGGAAVYAIAGLEEVGVPGGRFIPYIMGVARNVLAGPGETIQGVDIVMNIPLDHFLDVQLADLPPGVDTGPDRFRVQANIDLGGEGYIVSDQFVDNELDVIRFPDATDPFRFVATPALTGALSDARYRVEAQWVTLSGAAEIQPLTAGVEENVRAVDATLVMDGFKGIPDAVAPTSFAFIPEDRVFRWEAEGEDPSFYLMIIQGLDGLPIWRVFVPGDQREAPVPDFSSIADLRDVPSLFQWAVFAIDVPGFDFNELRYDYLANAFWRRWAINAWLARNTP